jgi:DNA-binding NarL/FixJ family response regulator
MKKVVLVNAGLAVALSAVLDSSRYRIMECDDFNEEELRLTGASIDACILDVDLTTVEPIRQVEKLRRLLPQCPVIIYASETDRRWEEEAYLLKVSHVLDKPMRERLLNSLLDRPDKPPSRTQRADPPRECGRRAFPPSS